MSYQVMLPSATSAAPTSAGGQERAFSNLHGALGTSHETCIARAAAPDGGY